jgi:hypothetical protein
MTMMISIIDVGKDAVGGADTGMYDVDNDAMLFGMISRIQKGKQQ